MAERRGKNTIERIYLSISSFKNQAPRADKILTFKKTCKSDIIHCSFFTNFTPIRGVLSDAHNLKEKELYEGHKNLLQFLF